MTPDDLIRKRARKIVDAGDVPKATLQESITLNEKVDALIEGIKSIPGVPEFPTEMTVSNLPEIQRVEITNLPEEKEDTEIKDIIKELSKTLKQKRNINIELKLV